MLGNSGSYSSYPIGYSGQYTDWETGLVYYGKRFYNPKHGRFINRDPIEESGGNNLYAFAGNSPTQCWDFRGMLPQGATSLSQDPSYWQAILAFLRRQYGGTGSGNFMYAPQSNGTVETNPAPSDSPGFADGSSTAVTAGPWISPATGETVGGSTTAWVGYDDSDYSGADSTIGDEDAPNRAMDGTTIGPSAVGPSGSYSQTINWGNRPATSNGLIVQRITAHYYVTNASGGIVQSLDRRINGATSYSFAEAWEVQNGVVGVTINGIFYPKPYDTILVPGWPSGVVNGTVSISAQAQFLPNAKITSINWDQDTGTTAIDGPNSLSGNLPFWTSIGNPPGWNSDPNSGVVRKVNLHYNATTGTWTN